MFKELKLGHCPICGDPYREVVMLPNGKTTTVIGQGVAGLDGKAVVESNYREGHVILDDLSMTRVSFCKKHNPTDDELRTIFELTRAFMLNDMQERDPEGTKVQQARWQQFLPVEFHANEHEAHSRLRALQETEQKL